MFYPGVDFIYQLHSLIITCQPRLHNLHETRIVTHGYIYGRINYMVAAYIWSHYRVAVCVCVYMYMYIYIYMYMYMYVCVYIYIIYSRIIQC